MADIIDMLGMGPKRELTDNGDGTFTLTVTVPNWALNKPGTSTTIILTSEQADKFNEWKSGTRLIQDVFPELTQDQREIIVTGVKWDLY
jgi:hypothetical protein